eukprot:CAMPEP_0202019104 /NCGR_PEP_ID=MMETSP0905-20130828/41132_1 /ASSEMBLY_ACC=CAM_ASM_000554 /TAXON_ID=420261 /ORGANISM="Thalassiosira antarctica, Strain CCMP982" /LENGTH=57 /DNA_ID=CAMNT_0048580261 /DNA_START=110 /DNA_END=280 /DNA_ORIENTATION=-
MVVSLVSYLSLLEPTVATGKAAPSSSLAVAAAADDPSVPKPLGYGCKFMGTTHFPLF